MDAVMIANKMNNITKTNAMNKMTMAKETLTFTDRMIAAIICKEGNVMCNNQIKGLQEYWSLSRSSTGKSLMHNSVETLMAALKYFEGGLDRSGDNCSCMFESKPDQYQLIVELS